VNSSRGWSSNEDDLLAIWLLVWVDDVATGTEYANLGAFIDQGLLPLSEDHLEDLAESLEEDGRGDLVKAYGGVRRWGMRLTASGSSHVRGIRARRLDGARRRGACRDALLSWLYNRQQDLGDAQSNLKDFITDIRSFYEGELFTLEDYDAALNYLEECKLVSIPERSLAGRSFGIRLLAAGIDCIEHFGGSVSAYINRSNRPEAIPSITVTGNNNAVASASPNAQQSIVSFQLDLEQLGKWVELVRQALPQLGELGDSHQAEASRLVNGIRAELEANKPDQRLVSRLGRELKAVVSNAAGSVLGQVVLEKAPAFLDALHRTL
jgi:hypothetical protein